MSTYTLYSDQKATSAINSVGGQMMGEQDTQLLKQIFVAAGNGGGLAVGVPITGQRSNPAQALTNLLTALSNIGIIKDQTTP